MIKNTIARVAFVRFTTMGKLYPARCDRIDILEGHNVEVLMRAESENAYYITGVIEHIEFHRWHCSCRIENLVDEVEYYFTKNGMFEREINLRSANPYGVVESKEREEGRTDNLSLSVRREMQDIYQAIAGEDGEDAYLSDGVWIRPDGSLDDCGR